MLNAIKFSVTFPPNERFPSGQEVNGDYNFQKGFGAIVGPNESGKSTILEMIRFGLFGTAALRGVTADYKNLKVELRFTVRGDEYRAKRGISTAKLFRGDTEIAGGVKGVNNKVAEVLGFGMTVFDVACAANQGDIEKLGAMRPTERKQMVDSVIGLSVIDDLAKWCGDEALGLSRMVDGLEKNLVQPIEPDKPADYASSAELQESVDGLRVLKSELDRLEGWLSAEPEAPEQPAVPFQETLQELEEELERAQAYADAQKALSALPAPPPVDPTAYAGQHDARELWEERKAFLRNHPTTMSAEAIEKAETLVKNVQLFENLDTAQARLDHLVEHSDHHTCPECEHQWPVDQTSIDNATERLERAKVAVLGLARPSSRPDLAAIDLAKRQLQAWNKDAVKWERLKDVPEAPEPEYTRQQLAKFEAAQAAQSKRAELEAVPATGRDVKELNGMIRQRITYDHQQKAYGEKLETFNRWHGEAAEKRKRVDKIRPSVSNLPATEEKLQQARSYEGLLAQYETHLETYRTRKAEIEKHRAEEDGYRKGKESLTILRRLVKQHLVPSLNKVASHYLTKMTGGERNTIAVTEDFEITVDGQSLDTLSGSGKAVANLALRLGLGQVLTNGQLSVFLADEIDASMDKDRANNTALTLEYLSERVSQILLVTHKYPQADYYIELEGNEAQNNR